MIDKESEDWNPNVTSLPWVFLCLTQELYAEVYAKYLFTLDCSEAYVQGQKREKIQIIMGKCLHHKWHLNCDSR